MKVLFIKTSIGTGNISYFDMGIGLLSAILKKNGHETSYFSLDDWKYLGLLKRRIEEFKPDIIGFSAVASTFDNVCKISNFVKRNFNNIFCFCGGVHVTLCPDDINKSKSLDAICLGEGEDSVIEMVEALAKKNKEHLGVRGFWVRDGKKIIKNKNRIGVIDINKLPLPDREIFADEGLLYLPFYGDEKVRQLEFIFSRGCPFRCTYCSNHALGDYYGPGYVRFKDPDKAIEEVESVVKKYRSDYLMFYDDLFTLKKDWLTLFLKLYRERINLPFECNIRVGTCDREMLMDLKKSGCVQVKIGLESGDDEIRETVLKRRMTNDQIKKTFSIARDVGLKVFAFVMIGFPDETPKAFRNTVELVGDIHPDLYAFYIFHPYKGTELYNLCQKKHYLVKIQDRSLIEREDTVLKLPKFKRKDILYFFKNFELLMYYYRESKKKGLSGMHNKFLYFLYKEAPTGGWFGVKQFTYRLDRFFILLKQIIMYLVGFKKEINL